MSEFDAPHTLVAAICFLAASQHSEDATEQSQIAALFYNDCQTQFAGVKIGEHVEKMVADFIKGAGKAK